MRIFLTALFFTTASTCPIAADHLNAVAGEYLCKHSVEPVSGNPEDKHYWEYQLYAGADGTFRMQGSYFNFAMGQVGIQGGGQYDFAPDIEPDALRFQGQIVRANGLQEPYGMAVRRLNERQLYVQVRNPGHLVNITCER